MTMKTALTTVLVTGATVAGVAGVLVLNPTRSALTTAGNGNTNGATQLPGTGSAPSGGQALRRGFGDDEDSEGAERFASRDDSDDQPQGSTRSGSTGSTGSGSTGSGSTSSAGSGSTGSTGSSSGAPTTAASGTSYSGSAYQSPYGPMQVSITVSGTKITGIQWTQVPLSDGHSYRINSYAAPLLVEQAMAAQSATIDGVSGATYTTQGFRTSLQSAIKKAGL
ncbi:FMN-binding protein [Raineyella fluvialis]|uniref:FMN-binding protein n=1 Tax=Raineyella fluvialis TaxID=2662261 RepID=A0A5Q2FA29_9ACTN|nr:FMN-binding protein [Raineyella fluvialis]QGF23659.1 FMN-binding protein [Raineyella fluvialis]